MNDIDFSENLQKLDDYVFDRLKTTTTSATQIVQHIFSSPGKRIRPQLFFHLCKILDYQGEHLIPIATVSEYIHAASLLHDDVIDNSTLRRNKPTSNSIWGDQASVLAGDLIYSTASVLMAETGKIEIVTSFAKTIQQMSEGELLQLEQTFQQEIHEDTYFRILSNKTGALIGATCRAAGILAESTKQQKDALEAFGLGIGIAYQLVDDALDFCGKGDVVGKRTQSDLLAGKITLPVILLRELLDTKDTLLLNTILGKEKLDRYDINQVINLIDKYDTVNKTLERAKTLTEKSLQALEKEFDHTPKEELTAWIQTLLFRIS